MSEPGALRSVSMPGDPGATPLTAALAHVSEQEAQLSARRRKLLDQIAELDAEALRLDAAAEAIMAVLSRHDNAEAQGTVPTFTMIRRYAATLRPGEDGYAHVDPDTLLAFIDTEGGWQLAGLPPGERRHRLMMALSHMAASGGAQKRGGMANYWIRTDAAPPPRGKRGPYRKKTRAVAGPAGLEPAP